MWTCGARRGRYDLATDVVAREIPLGHAALAGGKVDQVGASGGVMARGPLSGVLA